MPGFPSIPYILDLLYIPEIWPGVKGSRRRPQTGAGQRGIGNRVAAVRRQRPGGGEERGGSPGHEGEWGRGRRESVCLERDAPRRRAATKGSRGEACFVGVGIGIPTYEIRGRRRRGVLPPQRPASTNRVRVPLFPSFCNWAIRLTPVERGPMVGGASSGTVPSVAPEVRRTRTVPCCIVLPSAGTPDGGNKGQSSLTPNDGRQRDSPEQHARPASAPNLLSLAETRRQWGGHSCPPGMVAGKSDCVVLTKAVSGLASRPTRYGGGAGEACFLHRALLQPIECASHCFRASATGLSAWLRLSAGRWLGGRRRGLSRLSHRRCDGRGLSLVDRLAFGRHPRRREQGTVLADAQRRASAGQSRTARPPRVCPQPTEPCRNTETVGRAFLPARDGGGQE